MTEITYETSGMWRRTLGATGGEHREHRERLKVAYRAFRENAAILLQDNARYTPSFTVHDVSHSDALWHMADQICGERISVNPAEAFVLGSAFLVHDAAMGLAAYDGNVRNCVSEKEWSDLVYREHLRRFGEPPTSEELTDPTKEVFDYCTEEVIRKYHAASASRLIEMEFGTNASTRRLLPEDELRDAYGRMIGNIAASHGMPVDDLVGLKNRRNLVPGFPTDWAIDAIKLGCILRLADVIHLDKSRAPALLHALRAPDGNSDSHWRLLGRVNRPTRHEDRILYDASMPFAPGDARLWWFALDYLRGVDAELRQVDAFLADNGRERMAARGVAYVDTPTRFARQFDVDGWKPIDATLKVSNVPRLVSDLGGRQLYGNSPEVVVRELIQNAQAAIQARRIDEEGFDRARLDVRLLKDEDTWFLEIQDNGIGMDEEVIVNELLDFGSSGWRSAHAAERTPGLLSGGFEPTGRFGIGFFSVFMLGNDVEVVTRSFESGRDQGLHLRFDGVQSRALLAPLGRRSPAGTTVRVTLSTAPYADDGLLGNIRHTSLASLVRHICIDNDVDINVSEPNRQDRTISAFELASATPQNIFDRLFPSPDDLNEEKWSEWPEETEESRRRARSQFASKAAEVVGEDGRRVGLMALVDYTLGFRCVSVVGGFRTGIFDGPLVGYVAGSPSRAARDEMDPFMDEQTYGAWLNHQVRRSREIEDFPIDLQLGTAARLLDLNGELDTSHAIAVVGDGILRYGEVREWAAQLNEIFVLNGTGPGPETGFWDPETYERLEVPGSWVSPAHGWYFGETSKSDRRKESPSPPGFVQGNTWESVWGWFGPDVHRYLLECVCEVWSCGMEELLEPVVARGKIDRKSIEGSTWRFVGVALRRPQA